MEVVQNESARSQKTAQFMLLYASFVLLVVFILYVSFSLIPRRSLQTREQSDRALLGFLAGADSLDKRIAGYQTKAAQNDADLNVLLAGIGQLEKEYPDSAHGAVLQSYKTLVGLLEQSKGKGDAPLKDLDNQYKNLFRQQQKLKVLIADKKRHPAVVPQPPDVPPPPIVPPPAIAKVEAGQWGPYYPELKKGSGLFETANPNVKYNIRFAIEGRELVLITHFEASFKQFSPGGIHGVLDKREVLYTAPDHATIDPASLPLREEWMGNYIDTDFGAEEIHSPNKELTLQVVGNSPYKLGSPQGTQISVQLNRSIAVKLVKR